MWRRGGGTGVSQSEALQESVVWAATRLRADLVSQLPVDVYRRSQAAGIAVDVASPSVLKFPSWVSDSHRMPVDEWLYSSQTSLDRMGNAVGVIRKVDAFGLPAEIELVDMNEVSMTVRDHKVAQYRVNGEKVDAKHIWHERQHTTAGLPIGLSPVAFAALDLAAGISARQFAVDWFQNGAVPSAILKNTERTFSDDAADRAKRRFKAAISNGDVFVTGKDWTYSPVQAKAAEAQFLEQQRATAQDLCRFLGVPGDLVDVAADTASINYANITQRNVQLMVIHLGPAIKRREVALSQLVRSPRFVKLNRSAILAMDEKTRAEVMAMRIRSRIDTPDELRGIEDKPPLTDDQIELFNRLFGRRDDSNDTLNGGDGH